MKKLLYILLILSAYPGYSQPELHFRRYTTKQGLVYDDALSICQDSLGFIWIGTKGGFSRFDGVKFENYKYEKYNKESIAGEWVNHIVCDNKNTIWFAQTRQNFLMKYDYRDGKFVNMSGPVLKQLDIINNIYIFWNIFADSKGYIWLPGRLSFFNPKDSLVTEILRGFSPQDYFEDTEGHIWVATDGGGVIRYNKETRSYLNIRHDPMDHNSLSSDHCKSIFIDSDNEMWVGTYNGLNRMVSGSLEKPQFKRYYYDPHNKNSLSNNYIYDLAEDENKNILIGTVNGLCLLNKKNNKIYRYFYDENDGESINSNLIKKIYKDNNENIWIVTDNGVGKLIHKNFKSFSYSKNKKNLSHNKVQYICEASDGEIWIATPKGVDIFNKSNNTFQFLTGVSSEGNMLYGAPLVIHPHNKDGMWIGTWRGGVSFYDLNKNKLINYYRKGFLGDISNCFSVFIDSKDNLWCSSNNKGLFMYNQDKNISKLFRYKSRGAQNLGSLRIRYMMEDSENILWFATSDGFSRLLDFSEGSTKTYLKNEFVYHVYETNNTFIWVGTNVGLFCLNKKTDKIKNYTYNKYLKGPVYSILEDGYDDLWIATSIGLTKLNHQGDSVTRVTIYREEDGFDAGVFLPHSCAKLSDGTILFGGTKGFGMFHPSKIKEDTLHPVPLITNLEILGNPIKAGQEINGQIVLNKSITLTQNITLNHKNNAFSIEFAGLNCKLPQYNTFAYQLLGYEKYANNWQSIGTQNPRAEFMNLSPGDYIFKLKVANTYGIWSKKPAELRITILPPWWKTVWFTILWITTLVAMVFFIVRKRFEILKAQKIKLEQIVAQRTSELKEMNHMLSERKEELEVQMGEMAEMNDELKTKSGQVREMAMKLHKADESKLRFFANISHEFRTPLSLIIAPLEKCLNLNQPILWDNVDISRYLHLMHKNAQRMLRLINQIIDFRKIDQKRVQLNISNNNIIRFIDEVVQAFIPMAEAKNINLTFIIDHSSLNIKHLSFDSDHSTLNIDHATLKKENSTETSYQTSDEKFENNNLSNDEGQMKNDKWSMINDFWFDPDVMEKILFNLLSNAIKYTSEGGKIFIAIGIVGVETHGRASLQNNQLAIKIADSGIGIDPENIDKIFDRFYRVDESDSFRKEGTGIGLSYTKELIELHQGSISVESEKGSGTKFTLKFPISKKDNEQTEIKEQAFSLKYIHSMVDIHNEKNEDALNIPPHDGEKQKDKSASILIVEDNKDLRQFIYTELNDIYQIHQAENGEQGLEILGDLNPNLIISDIMMPVMDGIEFCNKIKTDASTSHIPVILLTAKSNEESLIEGLETGADDYVTKPFNINVLRLKIRNLFKNRNAILEKYNQSIEINPDEIAHSEIDNRFLEKAISIVKDNIHDSEFSNQMFVEQMEYGRSQVYKKMKALTNQSLSEFIRSVRLKTAAQLFLKGNDNISDVCYQVGFKHPSTFSKYFSSMFNKSPRQFIKDKTRDPGPELNINKL